ncbi:hypothetical protein [Photobacterium damselae]|nr:hypothetical protein [Photobacterium damselae]
MKLIVYAMIFTAGVAFAYKFPEQGREIVSRADILLEYVRNLIQK